MRNDPISVTLMVFVKVVSQEVQQRCFVLLGAVRHGPRCHWHRYSGVLRLRVVLRRSDILYWLTRTVARAR